jgi:hypothetical protein
MPPYANNQTTTQKRKKRATPGGFPQRDAGKNPA